LMKKGLSHHRRVVYRILASGGSAELVMVDDPHCESSNILLGASRHWRALSNHLWWAGRSCQRHRGSADVTQTADASNATHVSRGSLRWTGERADLRQGATSWRGGSLRS
jgi:hypothetical protein